MSDASSLSGVHARESLCRSALRQELPPRCPPGPLTLEQVLEIAEARSESVAVARSRHRARRGRSDPCPQRLFSAALGESASYERALASEFEGVFGGTSGRRARRSRSISRHRSTCASPRSSVRSTAAPSARTSSAAAMTRPGSRICRSAARTRGASGCRSRRTSIRADVTVRRLAIATAARDAASLARDDDARTAAVRCRLRRTTTRR